MAAPDTIAKPEAKGMECDGKARAGFQADQAAHAFDSTMTLFSARSTSASNVPGVDSLFDVCSTPEGDDQ